MHYVQRVVFCKKFILEKKLLHRLSWELEAFLKKRFSTVEKWFVVMIHPSNSRLTNVNGSTKDYNKRD